MSKQAAQQGQKVSGQDYIAHLSREIEVIRTSYRQVNEANADLRLEINRANIMFAEFNEKIKALTEANAALNAQLALMPPEKDETEPPAPPTPGEPTPGEAPAPHPVPAVPLAIVPPAEDAVAEGSASAPS